MALAASPSSASLSASAPFEGLAAKLLAAQVLGMRAEPAGGVFAGDLRARVRALDLLGDGTLALQLRSPEAE